MKMLRSPRTLAKCFQTAAAHGAAVLFYAAVLFCASPPALAQLTPGVNLPIGSGIGQIPEPQPASVNLLFNTANPQGAPAWTAGGGGTMTPSAAQWDAGFGPNVIASANGLTDFIQNATVVALPATVYAVSGQFSIDPAFALATTTPLVRMAITWAGGVARTDFANINPATCALSGSQNITKYAAQQILVTLPTNVQARVCAVNFITAATPALTSGGTYKIFPRADVAAGLAGSVMSGAWQVEASAFASSFIATPLLGTRSRPIGTLPNQVVGFYFTPQYLTASYTYQAAVDNGNTFFNTVAGKTFTLPLIPTDGEFVGIVNANAGTTTIAAGAGVTNLFGPNFGAGGVASFTLPLVSNGAAYPMSSVIMQYDATNTRWLMVATNFISTTTIPTATCAWTATGLNNCPIGQTTAAAGGFTGLVANTLTLDVANLDVILARDGPGILALKNGTNAQTIRVYGTTTGNKYTLIDHDGTDGHLRATSGGLFVGPTGGTIDFISNAMYGPGGAGTYDLGLSNNGFKRLYMDYTNTATIGNVTINKASGRTIMGVGTSALTVTDNIVTAASHIFVNPATSGCGVVFATPAANSFTINTSIVCPGNTNIDFLVINAD